MLSMRQTVLDALAMQGAGAALRERDALDLRIAAAAREAAPAAVAWDAPPGPRAGATARLGALLAERSRLDASLASALRSVAASSPPFEIALRVEGVIAVTRGDAAVGSGRSGPTEPVARELDAIATRVLELWAPGFDAEAVAATFIGRPGGIQHEVSPPREHATLGWAPVQTDELLARSAAALGANAFATLCEAARREAAEAEAVAARLAAAEAEVPVLARSLGIGREAVQRVDELSRLLDAEQLEANAAFETAWFAVVRTAAVTPPLRLHQALRAASALLVSDGQERSHALRSDGGLEQREGRIRRALFIAALADVRAACDASFPGLGAIASGASGSVEALQSSASGPYRQPAGGVEAARTPSSSLRVLLDGAGAAAVTARALSHAVVMGLLDPAAGRDVLHDVVRRSSPDRGDAVEARRKRVLWHRTLLLMHERELVAGCARIEIPRTLLHEAVVQVHVALGWVRAVNDIECSGRMVGQLETLAAVDRLAFACGAILGLPTDAWSIAQAVAARIRGAPGSGAIDALAAELHATRFADAVDALPALARAADDLRARAGDAAREVSFLDRVNVFSRSASEERAEELDAGAATAAVAAQATYREAVTLLCDAARRHPVVAAHLGIADVRWAVAGISLRYDYFYKEWRLAGLEQALGVLGAWTRGAEAAFGHLVPASDVLHQYALESLDARSGFSA